MARYKIEKKLQNFLDIYLHQSLQYLDFKKCQQWQKIGLGEKYWFVFESIQLADQVSWFQLNMFVFEPFIGAMKTGLVLWVQNLSY